MSGNENYEIYADEDCPYGETLSIRRSLAEADGTRVFPTFTAAKRALGEILAANEQELKDELELVRYNRADLRALRLRDLPEEP